MSIVFGADAGLRTDAFTNFLTGLTTQFQSFANDTASNGILSAFSNLAKTNLPVKENVYLDNGFQSIPGLSFPGSSLNGLEDIKTRRTNSQAPQYSVFIKKKAFSTLKENNDVRFADTGEKLILRATKILFENKCNQISAYEAMSKLSELVDEESDLDVQRIALLADLISTFNDSQVSMYQQQLNSTKDPAKLASVQSNFNQYQNTYQQFGNLSTVLNDLASLARKGKQETTTTWVIDPDNDADTYNVGRGSGVIELTSVSSLNTGLSLGRDDQGSISFSMQDPLHLSIITSDDIEIAISTANSQFNSGSTTLSLSAQYYLQQARDKDNVLSQTRSARISNLYSASGSNGTITFSINLSAGSADAVTGSIDLINKTFNANNYRIILSTIDPIYQLTFDEDQLVAQIFQLLNQYVVELQRQTQNNLNTQNTDDVKYARKNLRLYYLGKHIVQPMDQVSVFIRGNSVDDAQQIGPLNALLNNTSYVSAYLQNYTITDAELLNEIQQYNLQQYGIDVNQYRLLRTDSFLRNAGMCIFTGVINNVSEQYSPEGGYVLDVNGSNNLKWLTLARVNTTPSLDQSKSFLEDPLTAFKFNPDPATGLILGVPPLLDDNVNRLNNSKLIATTGPYKGQFVTNTSGRFKDTIPANGTDFTIFDHLPGLVYKWKQGIISVAIDLSTTNRLNGTGLDSDRLKRIIGQTITENPFSGLDIADIVSILVTGTPHNYETFMISASQVGNYIHGNDSNSPVGYFNSLFDILRTQNRAFGSFQAYKPLNIDQTQLAQRISLQAHITQDSQQLSNLQSQLADVQDQLNSLMQNGVSVDNPKFTNLTTQKTNLQNQINTQLSLIQASVSQAQNIGYRVYGSQLVGQLNNSTQASSTIATSQSNTEQKRKDQFMQLRRHLDVKYNRDPNLFIVDDAYDKDLDIQAFALSLKQNQNLWNSTTTEVPLDICLKASDVINFEFFANTQGHIELRAPKYNKTPLSILLRMMQLNQTQNIGNFPVFLSSLFKSQQQSLQDQLQQINLQVNYNCLLLGISASSVVSGINDFSSTLVTPSQSLPGGQNTSSQAIQDLFIVNNQLATLTGQNPLAGDTSVPQQPTDTSKQQLQEQINMYQNPSNASVNANRLSLFTQLNQLLSTQQNLKDTLNKLPPLSQNSSNAPSSYSTVLTSTQAQTLLQPFSDLIEDDVTDTLGPGSSKRFIITDDKVIEYRFTESDDNIFTRVEVVGQPDFMDSQNGEFDGVPVIWAGATDFDMWKQYGWRSGTTYTVPFFTSADLQCAPYAQMLLSRQRSDIIRGSITVVGNEYYQLGDVVYVAPKDLLFYVTGIQHSIGYGQRFTTTLDLRYGHPVGEYIPTPLDVIGKNLIKNFQRINNIMTNRQTANQNIGVLIGVVFFGDPSINNDIDTDTLMAQMITGDTGTHNLQQLENAILVANQYAANGSDFPKVEVRGYSLDETNNFLISNRMSAVRNWLLNPFDTLDQDGNPVAMNSTFYKKLSDDKITDLQDPINLSNTTMSQTDINNGRFPKEELRSLSPAGTPDFGVEIVLVYGSSD